MIYINSLFYHIQQERIEWQQGSLIIDQVANSSFHPLAILYQAVHGQNLFKRYSYSEQTERYRIISPEDPSVKITQIFFSIFLATPATVIGLVLKSAILIFPTSAKEQYRQLNGQISQDQALDAEKDVVAGEAKQEIKRVPVDQALVQGAQSCKNDTQLLEFVKAHPEIVNEKIDWEVVFGSEPYPRLVQVKQVHIAHLLCSGRIGKLDQVNEVLDVVIPYIDFTLIDESNLWGYVGMFVKGSGNNVIKTAVAGASGSISGKSERRLIVTKLLDYLRALQKPLRKTLLDAGDNFALGSHTIPEFLVRQGNDLLALEALRMGATVTEDIIFSSLDSLGTTSKGGADLALFVLEYAVTNKMQLSPSNYFNARAALLTATQEFGIDSNEVINCKRQLADSFLKGPANKIFPLNEGSLQYKRKYGFQGYQVKINDKDIKEYIQFGSFSNQYRPLEMKSRNLKTQFLSQIKNMDEVKKLYQLFEKLPIPDLAIGEHKGA